MNQIKRKHFADLTVGERFVINNTVMEKIQPVYTQGRGIRKVLQGNARNVKTGSLVRGRFAMVKVVE